VTRPSLYDFAGGEPAFLRLATAHHEHCLADPVLNHPFSHPGHPDDVARLGMYWAEVLGGPPRFSTKCGDHSAMLNVHARMEAEDELSDRFVDCFVQAIEVARLPEDAEFTAVLRAYMAWATKDVHRYSPKNSIVPEHVQVPHWSWDGLQASVRDCKRG
jgi:hemoglobin